MEYFPRKKAVLLLTAVQTLLFIPLALLGYFSWKGYLHANTIYVLIACYTILAIFAGLVYPLWFSWMGDLVPEHQRGIYFGKRHRVGAIAGLLVVVLGLGLDILDTHGLALLGFSALFLIAGVCAACSYFLLKKQYAPPFKLAKGYYFSLFSFLKRFDTVGKFAVYNALFNAAIMIASPFFAVYMRQDLGFNYLTITIVSLSSTIFYILFMPYVGKFSDRYGNVKLFFIGASLLSINPLLWIFIKQPVLLIFIPQVLVGLANAALMIAVTNFTYNMVSPEHRALCISYLNVLTGFGVFIGSLVGGLIISTSTFTFMRPILLVFLISGILRLIVAFGCIAGLREEEKVKQLPSTQPSFTHPFRTLRTELDLLKHLYK